MSHQIIIREASLASSSLPEALHPVMRRIYAARGIHTPEQLDHRLSALLPYHELTGIDAAVRCLAAAVAANEQIVIIGDFDADGATSSALAVSALKAFGAKKVDYLVPNRFEYGYGLTPEIVQVSRGFNPDLIITVDNGISSVEGVAAANAAGIKVVITDHHLPAEQLPDAVAIVNPNQHGCSFPSKNIAGVGVIFYVMCALRRYLQDNNWFASQGIVMPNMAEFLDLVALGTVADVVPLDQVNRILVQQGLDRIRRGLARPGILALLEMSQRNPAQIVASDLGFAVAPRLNAAGRLDDMSLGIECLLTSHIESARTMAHELDRLNQERRAIEQDMKQQAMLALKHLNLNTNSLPAGLCLFDPSWHQGVIGILAGRIKDRYHRPTIAFAEAGNGELKGSARSISGLHLRDSLELVATQHPGLIRKFGGHAMAAGLTIAADDFKEFAKHFIATIAAQVDSEQLKGKLYSDGELTAPDMNLTLAKLIREGGPWGQQFPEPQFSGKFQVLQQRLVGEKHLKLTVSIEGGEPIDAIAFNINLEQWPNQRCQYIHAAYRLDINEYGGKQRLQLIIEQLEPLAELSVA
jgi:single-stranded-DNA-specific exonuclease